jgi:hypothetical protein
VIYKQWLDNEYRLWVEALQNSTVHNFKEHTQVKRMLGDFQWSNEFKPELSITDRELLTKIDNIGRSHNTEISGSCWRMIYYADLILQHNPRDIIEIGGGSGQLFAVMRTLGFIGDYYIYDLPEVKQFQFDYLAEVTRQTRLALTQTLLLDKAFCVSLYALGEFDDDLRQWYVDNVITKRCKHGFVVWNPHSGASSGVPFQCRIMDEYPLLAEGNKQLEW